MVEDHIRPLLWRIISKAAHLPLEDIADTVADAERRCCSSLLAFDPEKGTPFKFFGRIAYNERHRLVKSRALKQTDASIDEMEYQSDKVFTDRHSQARMTPEAMDFRRLLESIPKISEDHKAVFDSLMYGDGLPLKTGRISPSTISAETGLPQRRVTEIIKHVQKLIRKISGDEREATVADVDQQNCGQATCQRRKRHSPILRSPHKHPQKKIPVLSKVEPRQKHVGSTEASLSERDPRRNHIRRSPNVRKHKDAMEASRRVPESTKKATDSKISDSQSLWRAGKADYGSAIQLLLFP